MIAYGIELGNGYKQVCVRSWFALLDHRLNQFELLLECQLGIVFFRLAINSQQATEIHFQQIINYQMPLESNED